MCSPIPEKIRLGERLSDGACHDLDHALWTRRQFLKGFGMLTAGASLSLAGTPVQAFHGSTLLSRIARLGTNRVLVIVQLNGGNDGLNTVIPVANDLYYNARPGISIPSGSALSLNGEFGLHPSLSAIHSRFLDGEMAIVHGVGYPAPNLSHFVSTDVWMTGNDVDEIGSTGWSGRQLDLAYPDFIESPPDAPLAVQIGSGTPFLFQGPSANMGMALVSLGLFDQIAETGKYYDDSNLPETIQGQEIAFVRSVANDSYRYAGSIGAAADQAQNDVSYPGANTLASKLAIVARLIKGRLGSSIYHVNLGGFDTHADQLARHAKLMQSIAQAVDAFQKDLRTRGMEQDVLVMTFSEFGRRVNQNASGGTDHGTAAPMILFGPGVAGGLYGDHPALDDLDPASNLKHTTDFRSVYATVLTDWFGLASSDVAEVFGGTYPLLSFVKDPTGVAAEPAPVPVRHRLEQNYPNPFNPSTLIAFSLERSGYVELEIFDISGRSVARPVSSTLPAGAHEIVFDAGHLSSGTYVYRLRANGTEISKTMTLLR